MSTPTNKPEHMTLVEWFHHAKSRMNEWTISLMRNPDDVISKTMENAWLRQMLLAYTQMSKAERDSL
jgi:hypothetical protein